MLTENDYTRLGARAGSLISVGSGLDLIESHSSLEAFFNEVLGTRERERPKLELTE